MSREPVLTAAGIVGVLMSLIVLAQAMGWINWTGEQMEAWKVFLAAAVPLLLALIGGWYARSRVTPTSDPRDDHGRELRPLEGE